MLTTHLPWTFVHSFYIKFFIYKIDFISFLRFFNLKVNIFEKSIIC